MNAPVADLRLYIDARGLSATRGSKTVFENVALRAQAGEILVISGSNGSGKSTLLEILALLRAPSAGGLRLMGVPARLDDLALRRRVTLAMQPALLLKRSVLKNVLLGLEARGLSRESALARAHAALESVGAEALATRQIPGLSAGERQRVNLARALALPVDVLLLDEPTTALDASGHKRVLEALGAIRSAAEQAIVIATPGDKRLLELADHVLELPAAGG